MDTSQWLQPIAGRFNYLGEAFWMRPNVEIVDFFERPELLFPYLNLEAREEPYGFFIDVIRSEEGPAANRLFFASLSGSRDEPLVYRTDCAMSNIHVTTEISSTSPDDNVMNEVPRCRPIKARPMQDLSIIESQNATLFDLVDEASGQSMGAQLVGFSQRFQTEIV